MAVSLALALLARPAAAQINVTGTWAMEVTTETGTTNPTMTLTQDGDDITGQYSSDTLGQATVRGTVTGVTVVIQFSANLQGQELPVVYEGTVDANGVMTGTIDLAGGFATGTFRATKS